MIRCLHPSLYHPMGPLQTAFYVCVIVVGFVVEALLRRHRSRVIAARITRWQGGAAPWKL